MREDCLGVGSDLFFLFLTAYATHMTVPNSSIKQNPSPHVSTAARIVLELCDVTAVVNITGLVVGMRDLVMVGRN